MTPGERLYNFTEGHVMAGRPNLLFITTDHQRSDSIGMIQSGLEVTPNLNRLATTGAVFSRAYTTCPLCMPARTAMATGLYPARNGVVLNDWKGLNAGDHVPLHQMLADSGYEVAHVGIDHIKLDPPLRERVDYSAWQGNDEYGEFAAAQGVEWPGGKFGRPVTELRDGERVEANYSSARVATWPHEARLLKDFFFGREAVKLLEAPHDGPFALFVNLWVPHPPLVLPEPYASRFPASEIQLPPNVGIPAKGEPANRRLGVPAQLAEGLTEADWRQVWSAHLGMVNLGDEVIGQMIDALSASGRGDDTVVLFTADHGDHLGQHHMFQKMELYEQAIRVPLVISGIGAEPGEFDGPVSHLDVVPTLLDMLGLPPRGGLDGTSLASSVAGETTPEDKPAFSMYAGNPAPGDRRRSVVTGRHKYIYDPDDEAELYNLEADPREMENIASREPGIVEELHEACRQWAKSHGDGEAFSA